MASRSNHPCTCLRWAEPAWHKLPLLVALASVAFVLFFMPAREPVFHDLTPLNPPPDPITKELVKARESIEQEHLGAGDAQALAGLIAKGRLTEAQKQTIEIVVDSNKYLISLVTALFGAVAFFLKKYGDSVRRLPMGLSLLASLGLLVGSYYYAFLTYAGLTSELARDSLAIQPTRSRVLYFLETEFWLCSAACLVLLTILAVGVLSAPLPGAASSPEEG